MFQQTNKNLPTWYLNYGKLLTEEEATVAVFSEDAKERLKQYLDSNDNLLTAIEEQYRTVPENQIKEVYIELSTEKFKVQPGDGLSLVIDKTDSTNPTIIASIENDSTLVGNLDLSTAAGMVYNSMDGAGTDELAFAAPLAAIHMSLAERKVSDRGVQRVFDIFNDEAYGTKYESETLDEWIDGDFDGRDEACAMALARRPIPKSFIRGISWGTVLTDLGLALLAIPTLGASLAGTSVARGALAGGKAAAKLAKTVKKGKRIQKVVAKGKAATKAIKAGKTFSRITNPMLKGWKALGASTKIAKLKAIMPLGREIEWISKAGKSSTVKVMKYFKNAKGQWMVKLQNVGKDGKLAAGAFNASVANVLSKAGKPGGMTMEMATKLAVAAGLTGAISKAETGNLEGIVGEDEAMDDMFNPYNPAELLGYYDQTIADPDKAMNQYKNAAATDLAIQLHDAMDGWTDNSDEMAIALMILSMDRVTAQEVKKEYEKMYATNFYEEVISSELEATMEELVGCYWAAMTGDGPYVSVVKEALAKISS